MLKPKLKAINVNTVKMLQVTPGSWRSGKTVVDGNRVFTDNDLIYPMENGYFGNFDNGLWYQVSGGNGTIIASGSCV